MTEPPTKPRLAIVDFGMGNLFSVRGACDHAGVAWTVTASPDAVLAADGVILPGVGAMPDAMATLRDSGLAEALVRVAAAGKPLLGICLGLQLLMREGTEFETHAGLGIIPGTVVRLADSRPDGRRRKVPHVGWNRILRYEDKQEAWDGTPLADLPNGAFMYFVHSYYVAVDDVGEAIAWTEYDGKEFCCALRRGNVFGCQFHPERSGPQGLRIYKQFVKLVNQACHAQEP